MTPTRAAMPEALDPLRQGLADLGRSRRIRAWAAGALRGLAAWLLLVLAAVILDAAWPLPTAGRWAMLGILLGLLPVLVLMRRSRNRASEREMLGDARTLECAAHDHANALVNGVQVGPMQHQTGDAFAATLAQRAHQRGLTRFEQADRDAVIDRRTLHRQAGNLYAAAAAWLIVMLIHPGLLGGGLVRVGLPWGDHPPFALTELEVTIDPAQPTVGDDVSVTATTAGKIAETATIVQLDAEDRAQRRWPMSARPQSHGSFSHAFVNVREPIRFRVEAGDARSRVYTITPRLADESAGAPDATASAIPDTQDAAEAPVEAGGGSVASMLPDIYERLNDLIDRAASLQERAAQLAEGPASDAQREAWREAMAALDTDLGAFQQDAAALAGDVRGEADRHDEPVRGQLQRLADAIEALGLCRTGACPSPMAAPDSAGPTPKTGQGAGAGVGAGGGELGPAGQWAAGVRDAGRGAVTTLRAQRQRLDQALAGGGRLDPDAEADTPSRPEPDVATGAAEQQQDTADPDRRLREAILDQAPPAYRELTDQYFDRLATEAE